MIGVQKENIKVSKELKPTRGARKRAVARVWIWERDKENAEEIKMNETGKEGIEKNEIGKNEKEKTPQIYVNRIKFQDYFKDKVLQIIASRPLEVTDRANKYVVFATVSGGGISAQAQAIAHGISRALEKKEPELRKILKPLGLLRRDPREVERKKYARRKARKRQQWKKR